jgi:NTP pyrophosphatase (non-canonical NTP hydrolase)
MIDKQLLDFIKSLSENDTKTLTQKALKTSEEVGELAKAVLPFEGAAGTLHRFTDKEKILEEACDTMLCSMSVANQIATEKEISDMLWAKSRKWSELQCKEGKTKFPIPYEIHITVNKDADFKLFKMVCENMISENINVKPLAIDLYSHSGEIILDEVMTSCKFIGNNQTAYGNMDVTTRALIKAGFKIVRQKIETVPWHPAAPSIDGHRDMRNKYFESHIELMCTLQNLPAIQKFLNESLRDTHVSINTAKPVEADGRRPILITLRDYNAIYEPFRADTQNLYNLLEGRGPIYGWDSVQKPVIEFSLYDTNISHDNSWIKEKV